MTRPASAPAPARGAAPVGQLDELAPLEIIAIMFLRMWCEGGSARRQMTQDLALALGQDDADTAAALFDDLMRLTLSCARRPLMRHGVPCACFGGDECAFANMLGAAIAGDREDAMLFSAILIDGHAAYPATVLAQDLSPYLLRFARAARAAGPGLSGQTHPLPAATRH